MYVQGYLVDWLMLNPPRYGQLNTFEEKLLAKREHDLILGDDGDTTSPSLDPHTPEMPSNSGRSDLDGSDDDDFWM
jgi:hypothetical protein